MGAGMGVVGMVVYIAFIFGIMWLIVVRPQKKRERQIVEMQAQIKVGQTVLLSSGIYGKVVDIINDLFIIEMGLNKSVRVPVKRDQVAGVETPNLKIVKEVVAVETIEVDDDTDDEEYDDEE
ncbi:preprotein translocase subunit YajC [Candidatus Epulonipiscium viviparus]|uniref:preprotein translocase subunit YajC n=1 Tax=Candidatus Epulonipiscium viviparus TaxID=420336 RepID=UPI002738129D|nr:preprotein translocase subunit YajC [Candidatus Epulopiscium viviparus]